MAKIQAIGKTALYERLSKDDELKGESNSISNQKMYLEDYARRNGFINLEHYTDDGYSGTDFDRPGFQRLIKDVEAGKINTVIVKDMSRFGRNYLQVGYYTEMVFPENKVRFIAVNNNVDSNNPTENDFTPFLNIMNEWYARDTSNKIKAVFESRMREGLRCSGGIPYGYNRLPNDKQTLIVDPVASEVVKRIFKMKAEGKNIADICRTLENEKVLIPKAYTKKYHPEQNNGSRYIDPYKWSSTTVSQILERKEYLGHTILRKTATPNFKTKKREKLPPEEHFVFYNTHEPIIDEETWELAQKMLNLRRSKRKVKEEHYTKEHEFRGYLFCADCGEKMSINTTVKNNGDFFVNYRCGAYVRNSKKCASHYINAYDLTEIFLSTMQRISKKIDINEEEFVECLKEKYEKNKNKELSENELLIKDKEKRLTELEKLIEGLYENFILNILPEKQYQSLMKKYSEEQTTLTKELMALKEAVAEEKSDKVSVDRFMKIIKKYMHPTEISGEMLRELVDKIVIHQATGSGNNREQEVDIYFNFIGEFDLEYSEEELAEIKAQKEKEQREKEEMRKARDKANRERRKAEYLASKGGHKYAKKTCVYCGKEYWPNNTRQMYCSKACLYAKSQERIKAKRFEEKGNHLFRQKNCILCGKPFWPSNGQEVLCSKECKEKHSKEHRRQYYEANRERFLARDKQRRLDIAKQAMLENDGHRYPAQICEVCGEEYWPVRPSQKYCSKKCSRKKEEFVRYNRNPDEKEGHKFFKKTCIMCGKEFWPNGSNDICCSDECRKARISERHKKNYRIARAKEKERLEAEKNQQIQLDDTVA